MTRQLDTSAMELLENDGSAFGRNTLLKEIDGMAATVKTTFDQGVSPDKKESMEKLQTAIESARQIVDAVWTEMNG